ncbi:uncharacterized protein N7515_009289 [Penicillium bovifimosum]|uniref:HNH nuclease domain-containing protein n=1 Tax=Penicillium bovifimosum TaxID=126998 RepID=A0A9W9KVP1_9EURO|nr:uncharacterized protein N7515_009289 [Penicillium bovifimosum]KAJ5121328.1 hypothetical protein N7515_009289 [Penicillium bovifimosum]
MSESDEILSPAVSSTGFPTFAEAKLSLDAALASYQSDPEDHTDDTKRFLEICFTYFPLEGQVNLSDDVRGCNDNDEFRQLANSIDTDLLRPLLSKGGKTPPSPHLPGTLASFLKIRSKTSTQRLETSNIGALNTISLATNQEESYTRRISEIWTQIFRYFPSLLSTFDMPSEAVNREDNIMMMLNAFHGGFGRFHFVLEATSTPHQYRIKTFPRLSTLCELALPRDRLVSFTNQHSRIDLPGAAHLEFHAAIGNILHASGRGETIEKLIRNLGETAGSSPFTASLKFTTDSKVKQQPA